MAKVSELKERARTLEQQGELANARAIYEHILKHLEGTSALLPELPMFVKVGDLSLKLGDPAGAVAMYEKAAGYYAAAGSAKSIGALVEKIRRADPTRDDAAVGLGRALLAHGHAGAAAEVVLRYARRVDRGDVIGLLADIAPSADDPTSQGLVESAISMLAGPPPAPPAPAPVADVPPRPPHPPQPDRHVEPEPVEAVHGEGEEPAPRIDLPLLTFEPEAAPSEPSPAVSETEGLVIRHGVEAPSVAPAPPIPPAPPVSEPDFTAPIARRPEPAPEPDFTAPLAREPEPAREPAAALPAEPRTEAVREPEEGPRHAEPAPQVPLEPEAAPAPKAAEPRPRSEPGERPSHGRPWPEEPHLLVGEPRTRKEGRGRLLAAGIAVVVIVGGVVAAWMLGLLPFGRGGAEPQPAPGLAGTVQPAESLTPPGDTTGVTVPGDTAQFGPIGFNTITNAPAEGPAEDTASGDTAAAAQRGDTLAPPPPVAQPVPVRQAVVVPPGHAIVNEIVVIPGLEVMSVAETQVSGALGVLVVQRADDGEVELVATVGNFGPDTVGSGQVVVRSEGSQSLGEVRVGRYLVQARSGLAADVLSAYLGRLIRARPVN